MTSAYKILIVDDSSIDRLLLSKMVLKGMPCEIFEAEDGKSALNTMKYNKIDLVLLDLIMPDMSGIDVIRHIRCDKALTSIKVLLITASNNAKQLIEARKEKTKADGIMIKPFAIVNMIAKIESLLS